MKNLIIFSFFLVSFISLTACDRKNKAEANPQQSETREPNPGIPDPNPPDPTPTPAPIPIPVPSNKLCFLGDTGNGSQMQINVAKAIEQQDCRKIYFLGDLIYPNGIQDESDPLLQTNFFDPYRNILNKASTFNLVMGDLDHAGNTDAWMNVAQQNPKIHFPSLYYNQREDDICFVAIDTSTYATDAQMDWLETILENPENSCKFTLAFGHHSYLSVGQDGDATEDLKIFFEEHILSDVDLYISAQDHILSDEGDSQGTRLLISGGGGAELSDLIMPQRTFAKKAFGFITVEFVENTEGNVIANYNLIEVDGEGIATPVHEGSVTPADNAP